GFSEGPNIGLEFHSGRNSPPLVADLLRRQVALIVGDTPSALAAKAATTTVPIVFATGGDPVRAGLVTNLNRPGGNVTGVSFLNGGTWGEAAWSLARVAAGSRAQCRARRSQVSPYGTLCLRGPSCGFGHWAANRSPLRRQRPRNRDRLYNAGPTWAVALHAGIGAFLTSQREQIVALAARHRIPAIYNAREYVVAGGLMSYAPSIPDAFRQAGIYAGRILKGEKPADLPVQQSTKFEFVINLKTAKTLGLEIPDRLLALADEVIE